MKVAVQLEKYTTYVGVFGIFICKFGHEQKLQLVVLLVVDISLQISLYIAVFSLCLIIYLWLKGGREILFDVLEIIEGGPELGDEN